MLPCIHATSTVWPSGLRRWLQAPVRKGVGSNPTAVTFVRGVALAPFLGLMQMWRLWGHSPMPRRTEAKHLKRESFRCALHGPFRCCRFDFSRVRALRRSGKATPVGFEPTRGDPIGLAGRRLSRSAKVSVPFYTVPSIIVLIFW